MKLRLLVMLLAMSVLFACEKKGDKGDTGATGSQGPTGTGASITTYTGTISSTHETISTPVLTPDSMVDVRISSETNKWCWADYDKLDYDAKTVSFYATLPGMVGGDYKVLIQNSD